jgi:hypothetical protein
MIPRDLALDLEVHPDELLNSAQAAASLGISLEELVL